ncbi:hypothetical protein V8C43DRAFT_291633 [Trichoderma afarasin]
MQLPSPSSPVIRSLGDETDQRRALQGNRSRGRGSASAESLLVCFVSFFFFSLLNLILCMFQAGMRPPRGGNADVRKRVQPYGVMLHLLGHVCEREDRAFKVHFLWLDFFGMHRVLPCIALLLYMAWSFGGGVDGKRDLQLHMQQ